MSGSGQGVTTTTVHGPGQMGLPGNINIGSTNNEQPSSKGANMCRAVQLFSTFAMSPCYHRKKFICEKEATDFSSGNSGLTSLSTDCPKGWKSMFDSCYQWFYTTPKTWQDAEDHCRQLGVRVKT